MAKKALTLVMKKTPSQKTREDDPRVWRERALAEEDLFHGTDEAGRTLAKRSHQKRQ